VSDQRRIHWATARSHGPRFFVSGLIATAVDAAVLWALTSKLGLDPFSSRMSAIGVAMIAGYFAHRRLTFKVETPPALEEFARFLSVAAGAALINYVIYAAALLVFPGLAPVVALLIATPIAMVCSYLGYRFGVFRS
jgi:putative flippase GtrA